MIKEWADAYRAAAAEHGTSRPGSRSRSCAPAGWPTRSTTSSATGGRRIRADHWFYFEHIPRWVADREPFLRDVKTEDDFQFANHMIDRLVVGDPKQCLETILRFEDEVQNDYLILSFRLPKGPSHEKEMECIERFGKEVIAEYRKVRG